MRAQNFLCEECRRSCLWRRVATKIIVDVWGATLRGRLFEDHFWVPALRACYGAKLLFAGDQQQTFVSGFLSATPDGLLIDQPCNALARR